MSMLKYVKEDITWRRERISVYEKRILELKSIELPVSLALDSNDIKQLIKVQQKAISHNEDRISILNNTLHDDVFMGIENRIKKDSNLKEGHAYLLFEAYLNLKKLKEAKITPHDSRDRIKTLHNAYNTILPYLQTPTPHTIPDSHIDIVKKLYETLIKDCHYSKLEAQEIIDLLSPLDMKRKQKPKNAKEPVTEMVDPVTGEKHIISYFSFVYSIE